MSDYQALPTRVLNESFTKDDLNESLSTFKQKLITNKITYLTVTEPKIKEDFLFSQPLADLLLQLKDMVKKPIVFISSLTFNELPVLTQDDVKAIKPNITDSTIVQIEVFFKADELFVKAKYQLDILYKAIK